jgi:hypothetical protein
MPKIEITNRVKVQGRKGTSTRTTLHFALATAYGMSLSRNGEKFAITVHVDQCRNIAEVEYSLHSVNMASIIRGLFPRVNPNPNPQNPFNPDGSPAPGFLPGRQYTSIPRNPNAPVSADPELRDAIQGVGPAPSQIAIAEPSAEANDFGNPPYVLITPTSPVVRGIYVNVTQPEPIKAPWLLVREHVT